MSYQRMTLVERMDIFRLLYGERLKPSAIAVGIEAHTLQHYPRTGKRHGQGDV
jgi:hypothetical protein